MYEVLDLIPLYDWRADVVQVLSERVDMRLLRTENVLDRDPSSLEKKKLPPKFWLDPDGLHRNSAIA